jgi:hypothetical protein
MPYHQALKDLNALFIAFHHAHVNADGIAHGDWRKAAIRRVE